MKILLIRSAADLEECRARVAEALAYRCRRDRRSPDGALLSGIWVHPEMVVDVPDSLTLRLGPDRSVRMYVEESFGLSRVWTVCVLQPREAEHPLPAHLSRAAVVRALSDSRHGREGRWVPVFPADTPPDDLRAELADLLECFPGRIEPPILQDVDTGQLTAAGDRRRA